MASTNSPWFNRVWLTDDGLPNNNVTGLAQTPDGYLWVATSAQLTRFDGLRFENLSPQWLGQEPGQRIPFVHLSRDGGLWLAVARGSVKPSVIAYVQAGSNRLFTNEPLNVAVQTFLEDAEGALWITHSGGAILRLRRTGEITAFAGNEGVPRGRSCALALDRRGRLWFAKNGQVGIVRQDRFETLVQTGDSALCVAAASDGGVWLCSGSQLFKYAEGGELKTLGAFQPPSLATAPTAIFEDSHGAVWIGTSDSGLFRYDGSGLRRAEARLPADSARAEKEEGRAHDASTTAAGFEKVPTSHPRISVSGVMEDREGNLWVGTDGGGLNQVRRRVVGLEGVDRDLPFATRSLAEDAKGLLWAVTENGALACRQPDGVWRNATADAGLPEANASCVAADRTGSVWVGTKTGNVYQLRDGQVTVWGKDETLGRFVRGLLVASNGDLWVGGYALHRLRNGQVRAYRTPPRAGLIRALAEDAGGNIWAGTAIGVLLRVSGDELVNETPHTTGDPISIRSLATTPDGCVWIGYASIGLGRLKNGRFSRITTEQGLYDDYISQIVPDGRGWFWFGADHGIFRVREESLHDVADGRAERVQSFRFGKEDGLVGLQASYDAAPGAMRGRDGRLWIPTRTGVAVVDSQNLREDHSPPAVLLKRVQVDERTIAKYGGGMPVQNAVSLPASESALRLPPGHRRLDFDFAAPSFTAPENLRFRYRLDGFDDEWTETEQGNASYSRLPAGLYHFRVKACNARGLWDENSAALAFTITPFLWQTWWFQFAALVLFTTAVVGTARYISFRRLRLRLQELEHQAAVEKERTRIARDLHDDLGSRLTKISLLSELAFEQRAEPDKSGESVQQISATARQVVKSLDETVWAVNPRNDTLPHLISYIGQFAAEFLQTAGMRCRVDLLERPPQQPVSSEVRHNVFLTAKEAINNVVRHASASEVRLRTEVNEQWVTITIEDDGQGFAQPPDDAFADGLRNMRQRMEEIGGRLQVDSKPGAGTRISLVFPWSSRK